MDIMLVGGASPLMKKLSLKLHKEGHRILFYREAETRRIIMNMYLSVMIFLMTKHP